jgi:hypothetical protein
LYSFPTNPTCNTVAGVPRPVKRKFRNDRNAFAGGRAA